SDVVGAGMEGDEAAQPVEPAGLLKKSSSVEGREAGVAGLPSVANVVQPGRGDQEVGVGWINRADQEMGLLYDAERVAGATDIGTQQPLEQVLGFEDQRRIVRGHG